MQLTSEGNNQDLTSFIDFLCDSDSTAYPLADKVRNINASLEEAVGKIIGQEGDWQFDDTNYTDLPRGTADLVDGQQSYSFTSEYLTIEAVEVLNKDGTVYRRLKPIDHLELRGLSPQEYFGTDSSGNPTKGIPEWYDVLGDTIFLYHAPDTDQVTLTNGLRVWFQRTVDLFTTSDTTQEPGIPSPYHSMLAYAAAIPYCMKYHRERVPQYQNVVNKMTDDLISFYGKRNKYKRKKMTMKPELYT